MITREERRYLARKIERYEERLYQRDPKTFGIMELDMKSSAINVKEGLERPYVSGHFIHSMREVNRHFENMTFAGDLWPQTPRKIYTVKPTSSQNVIDSGYVYAPYIPVSIGDGKYIRRTKKKVGKQ